MTDVDVLAALDDRHTLALTAWAEARQVPRNDPDSHSPIEELVAVMVVVRNRHRQSEQRGVPVSIKAICLAPKQFSCWTAGSGSNHDALMVLAHTAVRDPTQPLAPVPPIDPELAECLVLADGVIAGTLIDRTGSATSYYSPAAMAPPGRIPEWARNKPALKIGDQWFLKL